MGLFLALGLPSATPMQRIAHPVVGDDTLS